MGEHITTFAGAVWEGQPHPDFTNRLDTSWITTPASINANGANNFGTYVYAAEDNGTARKLIAWDRPQYLGDDVTDVDMLVLVRSIEVIGSGQFWTSLWSRASGAASASAQGYAVFLYNTASVDEIRLWEFTAGAATEVLSVPADLSYTQNTWYWFQYRVQGTRHQARVWEYGTTAPNWQIDTTDATHSVEGWVGFGSNASYALQWDYFAVATEGDAVQLGIAETETPALQNTITAYPSQVGTDATSFLVYTGAPNVGVDWNLTGDGSLSVITDYTNAIGQAFAKYTPGTVGTKTIDVTVGV